jgi:hypothetical protein
LGHLLHVLGLRGTAPDTREYVEGGELRVCVWGGLEGRGIVVDAARGCAGLAKVKSDLQSEWEGSWGSERQMFDSAAATKQFLGELDLIFMWTYAFGLVFLSDLGDRFDATRVLSISMFLGGACEMRRVGERRWFGENLAELGAGDCVQGWRRWGSGWAGWRRFASRGSTACCGA